MLRARIALDGMIASAVACVTAIIISFYSLSSIQI